MGAPCCAKCGMAVRYLTGFEAPELPSGWTVRAGVAAVPANRSLPE